MSSYMLMIIIGFSITFLATAAGSSIVWLFKGEISQKLNTAFLGFASGVMIAASVWSLIIPAIEGSAHLGVFKIVPVLVGFILGGTFLVILDCLALRSSKLAQLGDTSKLAAKKTAKMFLAVTIHNIPEGLAVGFAFGAAAATVEGEYSAYMSALMLAVGIAIQNFPEGAAVSLPIKSVTGSRLKAFAFGTLSGAVEPVFAVLGFFLAAYISSLQPWFLSFAAGAMVFVVAEDLIPDSHLSSHPHLGTWGVMLGFALMMALDVALG